jgi:hypothetical protein
MPFDHFPTAVKLLNPLFVVSMSHFVGAGD